MSCMYLDSKPEGYWCNKAYKWVDPDYYHCYDYPHKCGYVTEGTGDFGCFLTTACVDTMGLPDDCAELEAMRSLRDDYILKNIENGEEIVRHYYDVAPQIIEKINARPDHEKIWKDLYAEEIVPCADLVCQDRNNEAYKKYAKMLAVLEEEYI